MKALLTVVLHSL